MKKREPSDRDQQRPDGQQDSRPEGQDASAEAPVDALVAVTGERDDLLARLQRVSADYLNYQKRVQREIDEARQFGSANVVRGLLDVLDDMERALDHARENQADDDPLLVGMDLVYRKAMDMLKRFGVETVDALNQPFDPAVHEALMQQPTPDVEPMTVVAVAQRGYTMHGRTIRPARVVVSAAPEPPAEEND